MKSKVNTRFKGLAALFVAFILLFACSAMLFACDKDDGTSAVTEEETPGSRDPRLKYYSAQIALLQASDYAIYLPVGNEYTFGTTDWSGGKAPTYIVSSYNVDNKVFSYQVTYPQYRLRDVYRGDAFSLSNLNRLICSAVLDDAEVKAAFTSGELSLLAAFNASADGTDVTFDTDRRLNGTYDDVVENYTFRFSDRNAIVEDVYEPDDLYKKAVREFEKTANRSDQEKYFGSDYETLLSYDCQSAKVLISKTLQRWDITICDLTDADNYDVYSLAFSVAFGGIDDLTDSEVTERERLLNKKTLNCVKEIADGFVGQIKAKKA